MSTKTTLSSRQKEQGMVAIMVTLILMIVISLIVLGFAQISRRNQRQVLDRQLSTQAFYAAETGVNDVTKLIKAYVTAGTPQLIAAKPNCASTGGGFYAAPDIVPDIDPANKIAYTCLMVNPTPPTLVYGDVGTTGTIVPLIATSGSIAKVVLTWQSKTGSATPATNCPVTKNAVFSPSSSWSCDYNVLRFDLVGTAGSSLDIGNLQTSTMTSFVVPLRPGSSGAGVDASPVNFSSTGSKNLLGIVCTQKECSLTINMTTPQSQYYMRVSTVYKDKDVSLKVAALDAASAPVNLQGAQAVIDATGKAQDVLRRIQVRVPLVNSSTNRLSDYALQSTDAICKRFSVMDNYYKSDANNAVPGVAAANPGNRLCE